MAGNLGIAQQTDGSAVSAPPVHPGGESKPGDGFSGQQWTKASPKTVVWENN